VLINRERAAKIFGVYPLPIPLRGTLKSFWLFVKKYHANMMGQKWNFCPNNDRNN
jgi:hypothetical protein